MHFSSSVTVPLLFTFSAIASAFPSDHGGPRRAIVGRSPHLAADGGSSIFSPAKHQKLHKRSKCKPKEKPVVGSPPAYTPAQSPSPYVPAQSPSPYAQSPSPAPYVPPPKPSPNVASPSPAPYVPPPKPNTPPSEPSPAEATPTPKPSPAEATPTPEPSPAEATPTNKPPTDQGTSSDNTTTSTGPGCPPNLKNIMFNGYQNDGTAERVQKWDAASWLAPVGDTPEEQVMRPGQIAYCSTAPEVDKIVELVNGPDAPEWLLTFNEPDFSYKGMSPTMDPKTAAQAIQKLKDNRGTKTKYIAPGLADGKSTWMAEFLEACDCADMFHAYNVHVYTPVLEDALARLEAYHKLHGDKPIWVTEIAPGQAEPPCSVSTEQAAEYMRGLYRWGKENNEWVERIFWNSGNQIPDDINVCNSYLMTKEGVDAPLLQDFKDVDCS
ncbi:MAG: hypothetical protein M1831_001659 [Alyxoria varia]|nr:MAG: hypothetical protein M1831_001659 [Alyxoria varia]